MRMIIRMRSWNMRTGMCMTGIICMDTRWMIRGVNRIAMGIGMKRCGIGIRIIRICITGTGIGIRSFRRQTNRF